MFNLKLLPDRLQWAKDEKERREGKAIPWAALARAAKTSPAAVSLWKTGVNGIDADSARPLAEFLGVDALWLEKGEGEPRLQGATPTRPKMRGFDEVEDGPDMVGQVRNLPIVGKVQAGPDGLLAIDDYPVGQGDGFVQYWASCENAYALRVRGESMSPRYLPGEFVAVDPCSDVQPSQEVIVLKADGTRMIKRLLWMRDGQACFESINKDYKNITLYMDEITGLHRVLGRVPPEAFKSSI